jgi:hypothetical protein
VIRYSTCRIFSVSAQLATQDMWRKLDLSRVATKVTDERLTKLIEGPKESIQELKLRGCTKLTDLAIQRLVFIRNF